jgi:hypothetical protein
MVRKMISEEKLQEQFLISFLEGNDDAQQLWNRLLLGRIEERLIDRLAFHFPDAEIVQQRDDEDDEEEGNGDKKKKKKNGKLSTQGAVKIGGVTPVITSPSTDEVAPKDTAAPKNISEALATALLKCAARKAATNIATKAGVDPSIVDVITTALKKKKGVKASPAKPKPKPPSSSVL